MLKTHDQDQQLPRPLKPQLQGNTNRPGLPPPLTLSRSVSASLMPEPKIEVQDVEAAAYFDLEHHTNDMWQLKRNFGAQARSQPPTQTSISDRRRLDLNLGGLQELRLNTVGRPPLHPFWSQQTLSTLIRECRDIHIRAPSTGSSICSASLATPLLTPPAEKHGTHTGRPIWQDSQEVDSNPPSANASTALSARTLNSTIPISLGPLTNGSDIHTIGSPLWLHGALGHAVEPFLSSSSSSLEIVSQVLPHHAPDRRQRPTYERICDHIQQGGQQYYITISHAVTQARITEDFPRSPPATPNYQMGGDSYFGSQTMFTNAVSVPVYHNLGVSMLDPLQSQQSIVHPTKAQISILERYIPPSQEAEILDLFDPTSNHSYLAHRLPELATNNGTLLFIYPTRDGATTFTSKYLGPILDPLLREMTVLKGMNTHAAERLGRMLAASTMFTFEELEYRLSDLCLAINQHASTQNTRSSFSIVHSEVAEVILEEQSWRTWFVEQEQARFKQDLVEYHQAGGNMPQASEGKYEMTAGMLARELTESIQRSKNTSGGVGVEVGVFVVRRQRWAA